MKFPRIANTAVLALALTGFPFTACAPSFAVTFKVIHQFGTGQDGDAPSWALAQDASGNLFGTAAGGQFQGGVVFELSPNQDGTWSEQVIYNFDFNSDVGSGPASGVTLDGKGNIYGSTVSGGPNDSGTAFELSPNGGGWTITPIYTQNGPGHMILDKAGNLYSPLGPGNNHAGAIAELSPAPNGWTYSMLHSFCQTPGCQDGIIPIDPLVWDAAGNLYGTTLNGGIYKYPQPCPDQQGCGLAFQMKPRPDGTWSYRILHWFGAFVGDGVLVNGGLVVDKKGNIYGTTVVGGPTFTGTVYKLSPQPGKQKGQSVGYSETQLYTFPNLPDCADGCQPIVPVVMDTAGNLYGAAGGGNSSCPGGCGLIYELSPQRDGTWKYTVLYKFNGPDGNGPWGVIVGSDGNLYGTTIVGGQNNRGVVFEITP